MNPVVVHHQDPVQDKAIFALRSDIYARHYGNIPKETFTDNFDEFDSQGRRKSHLLGAYVEDRLVGTCRLLHYNLNKLSENGSEVSELFEIDWENLSDNLGLPQQTMRVAEISKFAIDNCPEALQVKKSLLQAVGSHSLRLGTDIVLAVMTPQVERTAARRVGANFHRTSFRIRRDHLDVKRLMLKYHDYFLPNLLKKYGLEPAPEEIEVASEAAIDMVLHGLEDGPSMWWILPALLASL